jgi:glycosyltransferase involved in cell wall biosynthesis
VTQTIRVLLVETHVPGARGSMPRYADLVARALGRDDGKGWNVAATRLQLAIPRRLSQWLPGSLATWPNHLWLMLTGPVRIRRADAALVHILDGSYAYLAHGVRGLPVIATVHDLIPHINNQGSWIASRLVKRSISGLRRCAQLLADSSSTASDLREHADVAAERIRVAPLALSPEFVRAAAERMPRHRDQVTNKLPCVLHVGNNAAYKNREGVLRIFAAVRKALPLSLVMAGPPPGRVLRELVRNLALEDEVSFEIDPDDTRLVDLYSEAALFLFPSLYEGFGWPPLEAMACGCPVVCSSAGSLPEVAGPAALSAPAAEEHRLAELCISILEDGRIAAQLSARGLEWSRQFSLERMRADLLQAYQAALVGVPDQGRAAPRAESLR